MPLTVKQLKDVCLLHQGHKQCRYLAQDDLHYGKWNCLKKTGQKKIIDEELRDTLASQKRQGMDPKKQGLPMGDNCSGFPLLKHVDQGYDIKMP